MNIIHLGIFLILATHSGASLAVAAQPNPRVESFATATPELVILPDNWHEKLSWPKDGYVPTAETAIAIAAAVWVPIYGPSVLKQQPITALLRGDEWHVSGTFQGRGFGGTATARISKKSGCILEVIHGE